MGSTAPATTDMDYKKIDSDTPQSPTSKSDIATDTKVNAKRVHDREVWDSNEIKILYKKANLSVFKEALDLYKDMRQKSKEPSAKLEQVYTKDNLIFTSIRKNMSIFKYLLKFCIIRDAEYFEQIRQEYNVQNEQDVLNINVQTPTSLQDIVLLYRQFPRALSDIDEILHNIISLDQYALMNKILNISPLLYYSVFNSEETAGTVIMCEDDSIQLHLLMESLLKHLMRDYINIAKISEAP